MNDGKSIISSIPTDVSHFFLYFKTTNLESILFFQ